PKNTKLYAARAEAKFANGDEDGAKADWAKAGDDAPLERRTAEKKNQLPTPNELPNPNPQPAGGPPLGVGISLGFGIWELSCRPCPMTVRPTSTSSGARCWREAARRRSPDSTPRGR